MNTLMFVDEIVSLRKMTVEWTQLCLGSSGSSCRSVARQAETEARKEEAHAVRLAEISLEILKTGCIKLWLSLQHLLHEIHSF
jgi:hypothetical protein